jgi:hypothetical protein
MKRYLVLVQLCVLTLLISPPVSMAQTATPTITNTPTNTPTMTPTNTPTMTPPPSLCSYSFPFAREYVGSSTRINPVTISITGATTVPVVAAPTTTGNRVYLTAAEVTSTAASVVTVTSGSTTLWRADLSAETPRAVASFTTDAPACGAANQTIALTQTGSGTAVLTVFYVTGP